MGHKLSTGRGHKRSTGRGQIRKQNYLVERVEGASSACNMQLNFSQYFQQQELSDLDVQLVRAVQQQHGTSNSTRQDQGPGAGRLASFPGHRMILNNSPFFKAQIERWQKKRQHQEGPGTPAQPEQASAAAAAAAIAAAFQHQPRYKLRNNTAQSPQQVQQQQLTQRRTPQQQQQQGLAATSNSSPASDSSSSRRPQLVLTLESAEQQPAAMAVLQALYCVKPLPELLSELTQEQQLQVALLADMWQVPELTSAVVQELKRSVDTQGQLADEATQQLLALPAVPEFLQALLEHVLLKKLGDLQGVWGDPVLAATLLAMSVPVMEVFLSLGKLRVASEDTVLYTAQRYVDNISDPVQRRHVMQQLAPFIRCQHLSTHWLTTAVASADAGRCVLAPLRSLLPKLLMVASANKGTLMQDSKPLHEVAGALESWLAPPRHPKAVERVQVSMQLDMLRVKQLVRDCVRHKKRLNLPCPPNSATTPLGGFAFHSYMGCQWDAEAGGVIIGLYAGFTCPLSDALCAYTFDISVPGATGSTIQQSGSTPRPVPSAGSGWDNFFTLPAMKGGWDASAWAAKDLPTTGQLTVNLSVYNVLHAAACPAGGPQEDDMIVMV